MENYPPPVANDSAKTIAIVSYLTPVGWLIAYFALYKDNKSSLAAYHLRQSLAIMILWVALGILGQMFMVFAGVLMIQHYTFWMMPIVTWATSLLGLGVFVLWLIGFIAAINGEEKPIPIIGPKAQAIFHGL